jgi:hypothetical protein
VIQSARKIRFVRPRDTLDGSDCAIT